MKIIAMTAAAAMLALGAGAPAAAQKADKDGRTPTSFGWEYDRNGRPVPKPTSRVQKSDGSSVEEVKQGKCTTVRTSKPGEYRRVDKCD